MANMASDYYSALVLAVSRLANNNVQTRQRLYDHARSNIVTQLRRRDLRISDEEIKNQRTALETAIARVEEESLSAKTDKSLHHDGAVTAIRREQSIEREAKVEPASAISFDKKAKNKNIDMAAMPERLGAMLVGIALAIAIIASACLIYLALSQHS
jgi:hypothetical protein